jgi:Cu+-exporting ATPase
MTCSNCARHVTEAIQSVPGVRNANVSLESRSASIRWAEGAQKNNSAVIEAIKKAGYNAKPAEVHAHDHAEKKSGGWQITLWIGVLGTVPLMIGEWGFHLGGVNWFRWFSFALATVVQIFAGAQFYRGAWNQLKIRSSNMDTLVALGSTTAFVFSAWVLFTGQNGHLYFMEAAAIITLISAGHWIEARVSARASSALRALLNLAPQTARRIQKSETGSQKPEKPFDLKTAEFSKPATGNQQSAIEEEIPVAQLKIGDLIALRPGDRVPTDGEVVEGESAVDEAMLTGESVPVDKSAGKKVFAGTVNVNGRLVARVTETGDETALAHIIAAVQRAQNSRAEIQRIGDRVSNVFVPVVVGIALLAALFWGFAPGAAHALHHSLAGIFPWHTPAFESPIAAAFIIAAAVLIIACPCAMGLATPAAIMAGANAAARRGILIRDGVALEKAGTITAVLFDKTGTITTGKPEATEVWQNTVEIPALPGIDEKTQDAESTSGKMIAALTIAGSLASNSTHPLSQAIAKISARRIEISDWKEVRGAGIEGRFQMADGSWRSGKLGSFRWLRTHGVDLSDGDDFIKARSGHGATVVGLAFEEKLLCLIAVRDPVKQNAAEVVGKLREQGLKIFMVTGDNWLTAASIANQAGIVGENLFAEVRPEEKANFVRRLQQQGERVAFVGDGINDAPALEQADLGIAVSRASDVAREAADIILLKTEIEAVPEALSLARATLRTIKQNLFWAFFYNALGVPLAALGFMSPILCAAAMGVSDLVVIGNAVRLSRWRSKV